MLSSLLRSTMPMNERGIALFGKHALKTGLEVGNDTVEGQTFRDSTQHHILEGINRFARMQISVIKWAAGA